MILEGCIAQCIEEHPQVRRVGDICETAIARRSGMGDTKESVVNTEHIRWLAADGLLAQIALG